MALPKLEVPTYELVLPSTGKKIKFRPFLVKEHKILMMLMDNDISEVSRGVIDLVDACTFNKLKIDDLSHFDIEYIFLQLRSKSIGENVELIVNCPCGAKLPHTVSLEDVVIENAEGFSKTILITDTIGVEMRFPTFDQIFKIYENELDTEYIMQVVEDCISSVFQDDKVYSRDDFTKDELKEFLEQFSKEQYDKLEKYFLNMPKVVQHIEKECPECGKHNQLRLEGLENFFV